MGKKELAVVYEIKFRQSRAMLMFIVLGVFVMCLCRYPNPKLLEPRKIIIPPRRHSDGEMLLLS